MKKGTKLSPQQRAARTRARNRRLNGTVPVASHTRTPPKKRVTVRAVMVKVDSYGREWFCFLD